MRLTSFIVHACLFALVFSGKNSVAVSEPEDEETAVAYSCSSDFCTFLLLGYALMSLPKSALLPPEMYWSRTGPHFDMFTHSCTANVNHPNRKALPIYDFNECVAAAQQITIKGVQIRVDYEGTKNTMARLKSWFISRPQGCSVLPREDWEDRKIPEIVFSPSGNKELQDREYAICVRTCWVRNDCDDMGAVYESNYNDHGNNNDGSLDNPSANHNDHGTSRDGQGAVYESNLLEKSDEKWRNEAGETERERTMTRKTNTAEYNYNSIEHGADRYGNFGASDASDAPACICADSWMEPRYKGCWNKIQHGCPAKACNGGSKPWCQVINSDCATDETKGTDSVADSWSYCTPTDSTEYVADRYGNFGASYASDPDCINVNYPSRNPGKYSCDCVQRTDPCLTSGDCIEEESNCPGSNGKQTRDCYDVWVGSLQIGIRNHWNNDYTRTVKVDPKYQCPTKVDKTNWDRATAQSHADEGDVFKIDRSGSSVTVSRMYYPKAGWGINLKFECCSPEIKPSCDIKKCSAGEELRYTDQEGCGGECVQINGGTPGMCPAIAPYAYDNWMTTGSKIGCCSSMPILNGAGCKTYGQPCDKPPCKNYEHSGGYEEKSVASSDNLELQNQRLRQVNAVLQETLKTLTEAN